MTFSDMGITAQSVKALLLLSTAFFVILTAVCLVLYFIKSIALYSMAETCGVGNGFYGFIPFARRSLLGNIADKYIGKRGRSSKGTGKLLVVLSVLVIAGGLTAFIIAGFGAADLLIAADKAMAEGAELSSSAFSGLSRALVPAAVFGALLLINKIATLVALWKIYVAFDAKKAVLLLILSAVFGILVPIFLYSLKNREMLSYDEFNGNDFSSFNFGV